MERLLESLNIEVVENGDDITLNIYAESYMEFIDQGIKAGFNQTKVIDLIGGSNQIEVLLQVLLIRIKIRNHH
jgi:SHS2 domain-containing protein